MSIGRWLVKGKAEDQNRDDLEDVKARTLAVIGGTNWASGPPAGEPIEKPGALVMGRTAKPEPRPNVIAADICPEPEPMKETLRERWRRLRAEVESLEGMNDEKKET